MHIRILLFLSFLATNVFCQNAPAEDESIKIIRIKSIPEFIDSIKEKVLYDTAKFNEKDIIITEKGRRNIKSYSPLFFINIMFQYKLDIVPSKDVIAFANEILVADKIKSIDFLDEATGIRKIGANGKNGVIIIQLKDNVKVDLNVAGFKMNKSTGNNFFYNTD